MATRHDFKTPPWGAYDYAQGSSGLDLKSERMAHTRSNSFIPVRPTPNAIPVTDRMIEMSAQADAEAAASVGQRALGEVAEVTAVEESGASKDGTQLLNAYEQV